MKQKIIGLKLGWSIIHLSMFLYILIKDFSDLEFHIGFALFMLALMVFFAWRFTVNLGETFK